MDPNALDEEGKAKILFWPDGSIDAESLEDLRIQEDEETMMEIAQAGYGMGYIIQDAEESE